MPPDLAISLRPVHDFERLAEPWRDLERRADPSPFQRWSWVGCLGAERYTDPVVLEARADARIVALALCDRRRSVAAGTKLLLSETGSPAWDGLYVEHNGPLVERGREAILPAILAALMRAPIAPARRTVARNVVLSGVPDGVLDAAGTLSARLVVHRSRPAPFIDLAALPDGPYAASLGRSTRAALGRSRREYLGRGPLALRRAEDLAEASRFLDELATLHQASWTSRGAAGAFASPEIVRFHRAFVARALSRGEVELSRVTAGGAVVGLLYNLLGAGWVCNYQGGFDYAGAGPHGRPGLTCHELAIEDCRGRGGLVYDFLAGEDRYKRNLAHDARTLHWAEIAPSGSIAAARSRAWQAARAVREWAARRSARGIPSDDLRGTP